MRFLIIGGGIAGTTAAEELRKLNPDAEITLVGEEEHPIYSRVLLTPYIVGKVPRERIFLKKSQWYADQRIEWLTGLRAEKIDPKNKFVLLSSGREIEYDALLITTGADANHVSDDVRGVSYLRTLDDADHLLQLLGERSAGARGVMYGGGFIACEYLAIFERFNMPMTIAFRGPYFWSRVFDEETGELVNAYLRRKGVEVVTDASYEGLRGEKELEALVTDKGEFSCGILGIGVGVAPDLVLAKDAGLGIGSGILTNEFLETSIPGIYAAGDIAEFKDAIVDRHLRIGTWLNAMMQARAVAKTMSGTKTRFELVSSYAAQALDLDIIFVGDTSREHADEVIVRGSREEGGVTQFFLREGRLVGATIVGRNTDRPPITKLIQSREVVGERAEAWKKLENTIE